MSSMSTFVLAPAPPPRRQRAAGPSAESQAARCPPSSFANLRRRSRSSSYLGRRSSLSCASANHPAGASFLDFLDTPGPQSPESARVQGPSPVHAATLNALGYSTTFAAPLRLIPTTYSPTKKMSLPTSPITPTTAASLRTPATPGDVAFDRERAAWASMLAEFRFARRDCPVVLREVEPEHAITSPTHTRNNSAVDPIMPLEDRPLAPPPRASSRQPLGASNEASFPYADIRPRSSKRHRARPSLAIVIAPLPATNQIATNSPTPAMTFTFAPASATKPLPQPPAYSQKQEEKGETEEVENVAPSVAFVPAFQPRRPSVLRTYARFAGFRNRSLSTLLGINEQERI